MPVNNLNSFPIVSLQARVSLTAKKRGDIKIILISPSGTESVLLTTRARDNSKEGFNNWPFMTVHCWGERPSGYWILKVYNEGKSHSTDTADSPSSPSTLALNPCNFFFPSALAVFAKLVKWSLTLYGTETNPAEENGLLQWSSKKYPGTGSGNPVEKKTIPAKSASDRAKSSGRNSGAAAAGAGNLASQGKVESSFIKSAASTWVSSWKSSFIGLVGVLLMFS